MSALKMSSGRVLMSVRQFGWYHGVISFVPLYGAGLFLFDGGDRLSVRLSKEESVKRLDLRKETVKKVCLVKNDMKGLVSRVAVVLDVSASMKDAFENGIVQSTLERLLPLAMAFDDDGSMEVWTFDHEFKRYPPMTRNNFYDYIRNNHIRAKGGTFYSRVIGDVGVYYEDEEPADVPAYVIFITDGDNADARATDEAIKCISHFPIFFQFVGIGKTGNNGFTYLRKLDDMSGRYVDNANFFAIEDLSDITIADDAQLYTKLLDEYPKWLSYPQVKTMLAEGGGLVKNNRKLLKKLKNISEADPMESKFSKTLEITGKILDFVLDSLE